MHKVTRHACITVCSVHAVLRNVAAGSNVKERGSAPGRVVGGRGSDWRAKTAAVDPCCCRYGSSAYRERQEAGGGRGGGGLHLAGCLEERIVFDYQLIRVMLHYGTPATPHLETSSQWRHCALRAHAAISLPRRKSPF